MIKIAVLSPLPSPVIWDTHQKVETLVGYKNTQEGQQLLAWLTQLDFGKLHTDRLRRREPGTGTWLIASEKFQAWLDQPQTILLCPGMPGAGKSFIASIIINYLQQIYSHDRETCVTFLLCDFNSQQEQCPEDLLANLLKQLIQSRSIPTDLQKLFVQYKSKPPGCRPQMDELLGCLVTAMSSYERVFLIIGALDEYQTEDRTRFLEEIFKLQATSRLSVLATLRSIQEILSVFEESGATLHVLEIRAHQDDIHKFLDHQITNSGCRRRAAKIAVAAGHRERTRQHRRDSAPPQGRIRGLRSCRMELSARFLAHGVSEGARTRTTRVVRRRGGGRRARIGHLVHMIRPW